MSLSEREGFVVGAHSTSGETVSRLNLRVSTDRQPSCMAMVLTAGYRSTAT